MKTCSKCNVIKPYDKFVKDIRRPDGRQGTCKMCVNKNKKDKYVSSKDYTKKQIDNRNLKRYGVTSLEYKHLMSYSFECEICGSTNRLCYDHDHNKIGIEAFRGVLCFSCNTAIGKLGDNIIGLEKALEYLRRYYGKPL